MSTLGADIRKNQWSLLVAAAAVGFGLGAITMYPSSPPIAGRAVPDATQVGLGAISTIDPCGFVSSEVLVAPGMETRWILPVELRKCHAMVGKPNDSGNGVFVNVELTNNFDLDQYRDRALTFWDWGGVHRAAGLDIHTPGISDGMLDLVYQDNRNAVVVRASWFDPTSTPDADIDVAAVAARVGDAASRAMAAGSIQHLTYPADSAASVNLCERVNPATLDTVLDVPGPRSAELSRNFCRWTIGSAPVRPTVAIRVRLEQGFVFQPSAVVNDRPTQVLTMNYPRGTETWEGCRYTTPTKVWNPWPGYQVIPGPPTPPDRGLIEMVEIRVEWPSGSAQVPLACASAGRIAEQVWPSLP
ncbi:hypothetical protein AB0N05_33375 [Nocardia sp. NPDC051030]|uniref:hypothetical protein n=1 Tax=Nocardia sp. NPDC051030 TaxID=3155162 RepID=UPI00341DA813